MSGDNQSEDRPRAEQQPRDADASATDADDVATPVRGIPRAGASVGEPTPLTAQSFPQFDASRVPPRPDLPGTTRRSRQASPAPGESATTGEHSAIRDQWRVKRDEIESHVSQARDHFDQANERIKQRTGRDLILAIVIGVAIGAALVASLLFVKWLFLVFALAAGLLGTYELSRALRGGGRRIDVVAQLIAAATVLLVSATGDFWLTLVILVVAVAFVAVWRMVGQMIAKDGRTYGDVLADVLVGAFVQVYVPFLTSLAVILLNRDGGEWWVLSFIAVAVAVDTFAYASGLAFGKHPMAPRISPKKTWEGFAGAVIGSLLLGVLLSIFLLDLPWWCGLILGAAVLISATLGDLGESMLKRDLGIKDMSSWLPGHGGILDRLDSILPSTVPALALSFLLAPWIGS